MRRAFLTARWSHLCILTWEAAPELLLPHLPAGLDLDRRDGRCYASVVAFHFLDTRVFGLRWPGHRDFPEWNLRFYAREGPRRGVVFVRELVPRRWIAWAARAFYNEPYSTAAFRSDVREHAGALVVEHRVNFQGREHRLSVTAGLAPYLPREDSFEHWVKEHQWGFGRDRSEHLLRYEVRHPVWPLYPVLDFDLKTDFAQLYGAAWEPLGRRPPDSVVLAQGSEVSVWPAERDCRASASPARGDSPSRR
ncbi:MAG: DUF2071 domain-containing protein [Planctomycetota bacterium]|nr:MAG: DUF2071 domain-containing protein [Planctomycetota bacterium]